MRKLLLVLLLTTTLNAQERVLFIGNSYTAANSLSTMVAALASSTNLSLACSQQTLGGATLYQHAQSNATYSKLASQSWDYVVLQAQSQEPSFPYSQFSSQTLPYAIELVDSILQHCTLRSTCIFQNLGPRKRRPIQLCRIPPTLYLRRHGLHASPPLQSHGGHHRCVPQPGRLRMEAYSRYRLHH